MPKISVKSLRARLLILIALAVIPALLFIVYSSYQQREHREAEINTEVMTTARLAAHNLEQLFTGSRQMLTVFAELQAVRDHNSAACNARASSVKKNFPMYSHIAAVKPNGDVFCSSMPTAKLINIADRPHFQMAVNSRGYVVGEHVISRITGKSTITAAMPVLDDKMRVRAVVYTGIDLVWLKDDLGKIKISRDDKAVLTVLDRNLRILYRSREWQTRVGKTVTDTELSKIIGKKREDVAVAKGFDGIERIWAFTSVPSLGDSIFVRYGVSREAAFSEINQLLLNNLLALLAITVFSMLVAWFGSDYFVLRRMMPLQKATAELKKGNLDARVDVGDFEDEFSRLGKDFNEMAASLELHHQRRMISEEKYRTIFEKTKEIISVATPDGRYLDMNPAGLELLGYSSLEEIKRVDITRDLYFDPEERKAYKKIIEEQGFVRDYELRLKRKDGRVLNILASALGVRDEQGNISEYHAINRDITARKQADKELKDLAQRLRLATASAKLGIWDWDTVNNNMVWDDRMLELYGLTRETFPGGVEAWQNGLHPEDRDGTIEECQAALRGEKEWNTEFRIVVPDGTVKHIKANGIVIRDSEGNPVRMLGINFDITEHRNLERQLRQTQKMEAIGQLASGVAHDFNNILQAIFANLHIIRMKQTDNDFEIEELGEIDALSNRAVALTQSLLTFSRKHHSNPQPMDLNSSVRDMEKILARTIGEDIRLSLQLTEANTSVHADSNQIGQILINLAANARDAMPGGGELGIRTERVFLDDAFMELHGYGTSGEYALMTISDSGAGMDAATRQRAFEPFFTTKEVGKGTGLGLSMVYGITRQHNGFVDVYSEMGKGTVFKVYLPALDGKVEAKESKRHFELESATETILLVEDDSNLRRTMTRMLEGFGHKVIEACDGDEAISRYFEHKDEIDLVLMDVIMPRKSGGDAYQELKAMEPDLKIILMSGYAGDFLSGKLDINADVHFISKPVYPRELHGKIRAVLRERKD